MILKYDKDVPGWPGLLSVIEPILVDARCLDVRLSVAVSDLSGHYDNASAVMGSTDPYEAASTIKLAVVAALMRMIDEGTASLGQVALVTPEDVVGGSGTLQFQPLPREASLGCLARLMVTVSDNTATNVLIDRVGFKKVNGLLEALGCRVMCLRRKMFASPVGPGEENYIDARDAITLLEHIYTGNLLSNESRQRILSWMLAQEVKTKFGRCLPGDAQLAHKTGEISKVTHDMGYLLTPGREIAIAALAQVNSATSLHETEAVGNPIEGRVASAVYGYINAT